MTPSTPSTPLTPLTPLTPEYTKTLKKTSLG